VGGSGGTGPVTSGCGLEPAHANSALLHTTLNDLLSVQSPAVHVGGVGTAVGGFIPVGRCNGAFVVDKAATCVSFPASGNIDLGQGTIDFFFRPAFSATDGVAHRLVLVSGGAGVLELTRSKEGDLVFGIAGAILAFVPANQSPLPQDQWTRITVTWEPANGQTNGKIYVAGQFKNESTKGVTPPAPQTIFLGSPNCNSPTFAAGDYDDLKIYGTVVAPNG